MGREELCSLLAGLGSEPPLVLGRPSSPSIPESQFWGSLSVKRISPSFTLRTPPQKILKKSGLPCLTVSFQIGNPDAQYRDSPE